MFGVITYLLQQVNLLHGTLWNERFGRLCCFWIITTKPFRRRWGYGFNHQDRGLIIRKKESLSLLFQNIFHHGSRHIIYNCGRSLVLISLCVRFVEDITFSTRYSCPLHSHLYSSRSKFTSSRRTWGRHAMIIHLVAFPLPFFSPFSNPILLFCNPSVPFSENWFT